MPSAILLHIQHSVIVCLVSKAMHSLDAHEFHCKRHKIYAHHHRAVKIQFVPWKMDMPNVVVFHHILVMHTVPDADQNVSITQTVAAVWLVFDNIVETRVPVFVANSLNVAL